MTKIDTYQAVTDSIIARLEEGAKPWICDWDRGNAGFTMPHRANGVEYRGINILLLWQAYEQRGFRARHWLTFKQALELGGNVRKGEKGTQIVFFKTLTVDGEAGEAGTDDEGQKHIPMLRTYTVFNAEQCENLPDRFAPPAPVSVVAGIERDEANETILRSCGAEIREGGTRAYYNRASDAVQMPDFERFTSASGYLATLAHELCHWTGHEDRNNRQFGKRFADKAYAVEELVAELGAAFIGARLGILGEHIDNHAAYLDSWLSVLKQDKRAIFTAASAAQAAADRVLASVVAVQPAKPARPIATAARGLAAPAGQLALAF